MRCLMEVSHHRSKASESSYMNTSVHFRVQEIHASNLLWTSVLMYKCPHYFAIIKLATTAIP